MTKQREVEHRLGKPTLTANKQGANQQTGQQSAAGQQIESITGAVLDAKNQQQHRTDAQQRAGQIQTPGLLVTKLRQQPGTDQQQQHHYRYSQQKHRAPPEERQHDAPNQRADSTADNKAGHPDGYRQGAFVLDVKHVANEGKG